MGNQLSTIDAILKSKGYVISFEQVVSGSVVCRAFKGPSHFEVLARSVADGIGELARLLGLNTQWLGVR